MDHNLIRRGCLSITLVSQPKTMQPMKNLSIRISLNNNVSDSNLEGTSIGRNPPANSSHNANLHHCDEAPGQLGNESNMWRVATGEIRGGQVVEPENAGDAAGAVVHSEAEEFVWFEVSGGDNADGFQAGDGGVAVGEGGGVGGDGREGEEVGGEELHVGVAEVFHGRIG